MKITSKGQVTIPQAIREALGLLPMTEVRWEIDGDGARLTRAEPKDGIGPRGRAVLAALRGARTNGMTTDELMALTRGEDDGTLLV